MAYDAFISYSHEKDGALAPRLRSAIQKACRTNGTTVPAVFLDESGLAPSPALWSSIAGALDDSEYLVLLASPEAARSEWVDRELRHWLSAKPVDKVLQVLTGGELVWDPVLGDFAPSASTALAPALAGRFDEEPHWVDLRWAAENGNQAGGSRMRIAAAQIAAPLVGVAPERLNDELAHAARRDRTRRRLTVVALAVLVVAVVAAAFWAVDRSRRLAHDSALRRVSALAQQADRLRGERADAAALAAVEASLTSGRIGDPGDRAIAQEQARAALMDTVVTPPRRDLDTGTGRPIVAIAMSDPVVASGSSAGRHELLASLDAGGSVHVWDMHYGQVDAEPLMEIDIARPAPDAGADALTLSPDGAYLSVQTGAGVAVMALDSADAPRQVAVLDGARTPVRFAVAASAAVDSRGAVWDIGCASTPQGCGTLAPAWQVPDPGVQFADVRWDPPSGLDFVLWVDRIDGTTISRRQWSIRRTASGMEALPGAEASVVEERCAGAICHLLSFYGGIVIDIETGPRNHTLALVSASNAGFTWTPAEARVPFTPIATLANPRGYTATPNDPASDRFVVLADHDGNLYTQAADTTSGVSGGDTRRTFHTGGEVGSVDGAGTFLVGGDGGGRLRLFALAPGQSFVSAGFPDTAPSMPLPGSDLSLRAVGQPAADCCDLEAVNPGTGQQMALGIAPAAQVRAVTCGADTYLAWPREDPSKPGMFEMRVVRFPDPAAALVPFGPVANDRPVGAPALVCDPASTVLVAASGAGLSRITFADSGPVSVVPATPPGCCSDPESTVVLSDDAEVVVSARSRGQAKVDAQDGDGDLVFYSVGTGRKLPTPEPLTGTRAPVVVALPGSGGFLVGRGTTISRVEVDAEAGTVSATRVADTDAPISSLAVSPDGADAVAGTASAIEVISVAGRRRIGEPLEFPGTPRYDAGGSLWIHPTSYRNPLLYARADIDARSLEDRACSLVGRDATPDDWDGIADHKLETVCRRDADGAWRAARG